MKTLIAEDDATSRLLLEKILEPYGPVHVAANGKEAVDAAHVAAAAGEPYDLICLDIMMPEMDGQTALKAIRRGEKDSALPQATRTKIFMTTTLADNKNIVIAIMSECDAYIVKPVDKSKVVRRLREFHLIP